MRLVLAAALAVVFALPFSLPAFAQPAEHPAAARLRGLLPPATIFTYDSAAPLAADPDGVRLSGVRLLRPGETLRIAELELQGLTETSLARAVLRGVVAQEGAEMLRIAAVEIERLARLPAPGGGPPMPLDFSLESLVVEGLTAEGEPRVAIRRLALRDYGAGRAGALNIEGLAVSDIPQSPVRGLTLAGIALEGFDLAALLDAALRGEPPPAPMAGRHSADFRQLLLTGADGVALGGAAGLLMEADTQPDEAGHMRFALRGVRVENSPVTALFLDALGLRRLDASLTFEAAHEPVAGRISIPALALGVREIGAIGLGLTVEGWTPEAARRGDPSRLLLRDARLRYVDEGLYARALRAQAQQEGVSEEELRRQHAQLLGQMLPVQNAPPGMLQLRDAMLALVRRQARGVEVTLRPAEPVSMPQITAASRQGPAPLMRLLGVTAAPVR